VIGYTDLFAGYNHKKSTLLQLKMCTSIAFTVKGLGGLHTWLSDQPTVFLQLSIKINETVFFKMMKCAALMVIIRLI